MTLTYIYGGNCLFTAYIVLFLCRQAHVCGSSSACLLADGLALVASQGIELIHFDDKLSGKVIKKFTGHATPTTILIPLPINYGKNIDSKARYIISASANDTFVYMW